MGSVTNIAIFVTEDSLTTISEIAYPLFSGPSSAQNLKIFVGPGPRLVRNLKILAGSGPKFHFWSAVSEKWSRSNQSEIFGNIWST